MSVQRRVNWISQQRVDVPDMRAIESAMSNDFDQLIKSFVTGTSQGYILRGFEILMAGAIGGAASGLQLSVDPGAVFHIASSQSGTFYLVPPGSSPEQLNSATNNIVDGAFVPSAINYIGLEYERFLDDTTSSQVYIWNPTTNSETTKIAPRAQILRYRIKITTTIFASNVLPIATVTTDAGNNVISITDARHMLYRLGQGGAAPNPFYQYPWNADPEGRNENPSTSTSNGVNPFSGGDKMLGTLKDWMDAVMTEFKVIKNSVYWYSAGSVSGINLLDTWQDANGSVLTGRGRYRHDQSTAGLLSWTSQLFIRSINSPRTYTIAQGSVALAEGQVAYINLVRNQDFQPLNVFTFTAASPTITAILPITGIVAGDYIKAAGDPESAWRQVQSVVGTTITLTTVYPNTVVQKAIRSQGGPYTVLVADPQSVPSNGDMYWLAKRETVAGSATIASIGSSGATRTSGVATINTTAAHNFVEGQTVIITGVSDTTFNGFVEIESVPSATSFTYLSEGNNVPAATAGGGTASAAAKIYLRWLGELDQGEDKQIDDTISQDTLAFIGAKSETDRTPAYGSNIRGIAGQNLTARASVLTDAIGDEQEDRSAFFRSDNPVTWTGTQLNFDADIVLEVLNTKTGTIKTATILTADSPLVLANGEIAYITIDRTLASENVTFTVASSLPAQVQATKDIIVFAYRRNISGVGFLHLPFHKQFLEPGQTVYLGASGSGGNSPKILGGGIVTNEAVPSTVPDVEQLLATGFQSLGPGSGLQALGNGWISTSNSDIVSITVRLRNASGATGTMECRVYNSPFSNSLPDLGALLGTSDPVDVSTVPNVLGGTDVTFTFPTPIAQTIGATRCFLIDVGGITSAILFGATFSNPLPGADQQEIQWDGSVSYNAVGGGADAYFIINVDSGLAAAQSITFSEDMYIEFNGMDYDWNTIPVSESPITFADDLDVAYVVPNKIIQATTNLTVVVDQLINVPKNAIIIARREGADVIVGSSSTRLVSGQSCVLYALPKVKTFEATYLDPVNTSLPTGVSIVIDGQTGANGDRVLFTNLSTNNNRIYELSGVGTSLVWTPIYAFNYKLDPALGDAVRIQKGNGFAAQLAVYNGTNFLVNDVVRYFDGVSGNFMEQSSLKTSPLVNNTADTIFSVTATASENMIVNFSINRGGVKEAGQFIITHDGTTAAYSQSGPYMGLTGITLAAVINAGNLEFNYTADNSGADGEIKYFVFRWSDNAGGPTGIPTYTPSGGGGGSAAGSNLDIQFNNAGALAGDSRFKIDGANSGLNLNGLLFNVLSAPIAMLDNQASPQPLFSFVAATYRYVILEYSIVRNGEYRVGRLLVTNNGTVTSLTDDMTETNPTGINLTAAIVGANVEIRYDSTPTGFGATFKYSARRWN